MSSDAAIAELAINSFKLVVEFEVCIFDTLFKGLITLLDSDVICLVTASATSTYGEF